MTLGSAFVSLAVALVAGALVGAERQQAHAGRPSADFGGIRTFPFLAMLGAIAALLKPAFGSWTIGAFLLAIVVFLAIAQTRAKGDDVGVTSEIAAIITYGMGVLAASFDLLPDAPRFLLVFGVAGATIALLALKRPLHGFVAKVSDDDVFATAKFVLLAVVVIPLLPNETIGPLDVLNPRKIGLMIVLVAGVSFAGYVAARVVGSRRGLLVTGLVGGVVSSTALTLALSGRAKEHPALRQLCAVAITAACATMFARMIVIVGVADRVLLPKVALPLGAMAFAGSVIAGLAYREVAGQKGDPVPFRNPFEVWRAIKFGVLYGLILLAVKAAQEYASTSGLYLSIVFASLADVDAITLSLAELRRSGMSTGSAAAGITLAAIVNTISKGAIALFLGGAALGKDVGRALLGMLVAGGAALLVQALITG
jgi:uncharacterized membrane protein (DUF4010 family)